MSDVIADAAVARWAPEAVLGTAPAAGWVQTQVDTNGISSWNPAHEYVERNTLNPFLTVEEGSIVKRSANPQIVHDPNKDLMDLMAPSLMRCVTKHIGNRVSFYRPTAVTATGYTVPALGDVTAKLLAFARGFVNAANNGLKPVAAASTANEIKAAGLVVEAASAANANATLDLVGVEGSIAADFQITAANHLMSTTTSFLTTNLQQGQWGYFPSAAEALAMGSANYAFATIPAGGFFRLKSVAANLCELENQTYALGGVDAAAAKTVRIFTSRFFRNYAVLDANFARPSLHGELEQVGPGAAGGATYEYVKGCRIATMSLAANIGSKITATIAMVGTDATDPLEAGARVGGAGVNPGDSPAKAYAPQADALSDTQADLRFVQIRDENGLLLTSFVENWTLTFNNSLDSKWAQGSINPVGHEEGKFRPTLDLDCYYDNAESLRAVTAERRARWFAVTRNQQFGMLFDLPNIGLRNPQVTFQEGKLVRIRYQGCVARRNKNDNIAASLTIFGWLP